MHLLKRSAAGAAVMICCALTMGDVTLWTTGSDLETTIGEKLTGQLRDRDIELRTVAVRDLAATGAVESGRGHTWVLTETSRFPAEAFATVQRHLAAGGELLILGDSPFEQLTFPDNGQWLTQQEYLQEVTNSTILYPTLKVEDCALTTDFGEGKNLLTSHTVFLPHLTSVEKSALRMQIPELHFWCTFRIPAPKIMPTGDLTAFWAKGTTSTKKLAIEWAEHDGSRWIATVDLAPEWRYYVLVPEDFKFWVDNTSRGRGGSGDKVNLKNVSGIAVGLAQSHTRLSEGPHEFWVSELGIAEREGELKDLLVQGEIDGLYPENKTYPMRPESLKIRAGYTNPFKSLPIPDNAWSAYWRPMGSGIDKNRRHRFIPVVTANNADGTRAGTVASMTISMDSKTSGAITGSIGIPNPEILMSDPWMDVAAQMIEKMQSRLMFAEAGAAEFCYDVRGLEEQTLNPGFSTISQPLDVGYSLLARGSARMGAGVDISTTLSDALDRPVSVAGGSLASLPSRHRSTVGYTSSTQALTDLGAFKYEAGIYIDGRLTDYISQEIRFDKPREQDRLFVTARDHKFWKGDAPWRAFGLNYMPSSGLALSNGAEFEYWIEDPSYDPDIVQSDLERIKGLGYNMVSVFAYSRNNFQLNLLDLLHRCRELDLMVNLSLRPNVNPWPASKAVTDRLIKEIRAWDRDEIMGYDVAWEPWWGNGSRRMEYGDAWVKWVGDEHGTQDAAARAWNFNPGNLAAFPSDQEMETDGPWREAVKDYRRFAHDALSAAYLETRENILAVDPNHLISFRQSEGGNPLVTSSSFPVELAPIAEAVDFFSPEGYGIGDAPEKAKTFWFTTAYAQGLSPGKPVVLAEYGASVWSGSAFEPDALLYQRQAQAYENIFQTAEASRAAGTVQWWYPGGYRTGEDSDYGLMNPDGTDRPGTKVVRRWAERMKQYPPDIVWRDEITGDADGVRGYVGLYENLKTEFFDKATTGSFPIVKRAGRQPRK